MAPAYVRRPSRTNSQPCLARRPRVSSRPRFPPARCGKQRRSGPSPAWSAQDPAAAAAWIDTLGEPALHAQAARTLLGIWLDRDRAAAENYARTLPAGIVSDQGSESVSQYLAGHEPAAAIAWAERIYDLNRRTQALAYVLGEWQRQDPAGARDLLRTRPELAALAGSGG